MAGEWQETTIGELLAENGGSILTGPFGTNLKASEYSPTGVPIVAVSEVGFGRIHVEERTPRISPETTARLSKYLLCEGDIVFARKGAGTAVERSALVTKAESGWFLGSDGMRLRLPDCIDKKFVSYWLLSRSHRQWMVSNCVGSTMPALNQGIIERIPISIPPRPTQQAITRVLGTLDDKIELNRRMSATLEGLARAVFRSWFVDFDPVVAKAAGRRPVGMTAATAALFPDSFADSPLGPIPQEWRVCPIGDLVDVVGGSTPSTQEPKFWEGGTIHWATPKDLAGLADPVLTETERKITHQGLQQISSGLLPAGTVLLSSRAPIGYLAIASTPVAVNQGFIALKCEKAVSNRFVLHWLRENTDAILERANGTTFLEISKSNFRPIPAVVGSELVLRAFDRQTQPLYDRIVANVHESATLTTLRDALLPRLVSGELRLKDAERAVSGAV